MEEVEIWVDEEGRFRFQLTTDDEQVLMEALMRSWAEGWRYDPDEDAWVPQDACQ